MFTPADPSETIPDDFGGTSSESLSQGSQIGRYVIVETLGMGAMGVVFAAYDPKLDRRVALKLLRHGAGPSHESIGRSRLFREAQSLAKFSSRNVIQVHDVDTYEGQVFIAMEYIEGQSVKRWLGKEKRSTREILRVFIEAGKGLAAAHAADVIHRDFKPENVLIGNDGRVCVADFGLATAGHTRDHSGAFATISGSGVRTTDDLVEEIVASSDSRLTKAGRVVGTPAYMSPEQFLGLPVGAYTDQFAFCVALYEALCGRLPFDGKTRSANLNARVEGRVRPEGEDGIPRWLDRILRRGLMPHAEQRYPDMETLIAALRGDPIRRRRRWAGVGALCATMLAGGAGVGVLMGPSDQACEIPPGLSEVWNETQRGELSEAFAKTQVPYAAITYSHVEGGLDSYSRRWEQAWTAACEATHGQRTSTVTTLEQRRDCLDGQLAEFGASTEVLATADRDMIDHALEVVDGLPSPADCLEVSTNAGLADRKRGPQFDEMHKDLASARVSFRAGRYGPSKALAERVVTRATTLEDPFTKAEAMWSSSLARVSLGEYAEAEAQLEELIEIATRHELGAKETLAWTELADVAIGVHKRPARAEALLLSARMALLRAGEPRDPKLGLLRSEAAILLNDDRLPEAIAKFDELEQFRTETVSEETRERDARAALSDRSMLAVALAKGKEGERAVLEFRTAIEQGTKLLGADHPRIASWQANLANALIVLDRHGEARAPAEEALRIRRLNFDGHHPSLASSLVALGAIAGAEDRNTDALRYYEQASEILTAAHGADHPSVAVTENNIGRILVDEGSAKDALVRHERARTIFVGRYGAEHKRVSNTDRHICIAQLALGNLAEAERRCMSALEVHGRLLGADSKAVKQDINALERLIKKVEPGAKERISGVVATARAAAKSAEGKPGSRTEGKPGSRTEGKPGSRTEGKPGSRTEGATGEAGAGPHKSG
jgi:tRNA A-37 threonylcarbamoyl transferase component Bud32/tetratricopeptide (TPR) repeat protein